MKIEFRKAPNTAKDINISFASVDLKGTFCKISAVLVKVEAKLSGEVELQCCRCAETTNSCVNEELDFIISDGIYKGRETDELIIEVENNTIDFDQIVQSEVASIQSEYYICEQCSQDDSDFNKEF